MTHVAAETFNADPTALTRLAGRTMEAVDSTTDAVITMVSAVQLTPDAFGPTPAGADMHTASASASAAATSAAGVISEVWELDADNLLQTAIAYRGTDLDEEARLTRQMLGLRYGLPGMEAK